MGKLSLTLAWVGDVVVIFGILIPLGMLISTAVALQLFSRSWGVGTVLWGIMGVSLLYLSFDSISLWFDNDYRSGMRLLHG